MKDFWARLNARGRVWPVIATWDPEDDDDNIPFQYTEAAFFRRKGAVKYVKDYNALIATLPGYKGRSLEVGDSIPFWWFS